MSKNNNEINLTISTTSELNSLLETALKNLDTAYENKDLSKATEFSQKLSEIITANPDFALAYGLENNNYSIISQSVDAGATNLNGILAWGCLHNDLSVVCLAIRNGATNLDEAMKWAFSHKNGSGAIFMAVQKGANPVTALKWGLENKNGFVINACLGKGANPNIVLEYGLKHNDGRLILIAIKNGAKDLEDALKWSFVHKDDAKEDAIAIIEHVSILNPDFVLDWSLKLCYVEMVFKSLNSGSKNVNDALKLAIEITGLTNDREKLGKIINIINLAIEKGADVNIVAEPIRLNNVKLTAACVAIQNHNIQLFKKIAGDPNYNINATNINEGITLIDFLQGLEILIPVKHELINFLREKGSFESKHFISDCNKIDTTVTNSPDAYELNVINAPKILELLYKQYNTNGVNIANIINQFKINCGGKIADEVNSLTSQGIITETRYFIHNNKTTSHTVKWDSNKALATIILACDTQPELKAGLLYGLSQLEACHLGKLINLLSIAQHALPKESILQEGADINGCINYVISNSPSAILRKEKELFLFCQKMLYKNFTNIDILNQNISHIDIQKILSVFNSKLIKTVTDSLKPEYKNKILPSEFFIDFHNYLAKLSDDLINNKQNLPAAAKQLAQSYFTGADQYFTDKLLHIIYHFDEGEMSDFFKTITFNPEYNYGKLFSLSEKSIKALFDEMLLVLELSDAKKFMKLLIDNVDLSRDAKEMATQLIKADYILDEDNIVPTVDHTEIIGDDIPHEDNV